MLEFETELSDRLCCLSYFDYKVWKHNYCALVNSKLFQSLIFPWNISFSKYQHFKSGKTLHGTPVYIIITEKLNSNSWWTDFDFWGLQLRFIRLFRSFYRVFRLLFVSISKRSRQFDTNINNNFNFSNGSLMLVWKDFFFIFAFLSGSEMA